MSPAFSDFSALSRAGGTAGAQVPRPPSRPVTRVLVPALIILSVLGLLAYAARESLRPTITVAVAPAVLRAAGATGVGIAAPGEVVQAPGWIEADPSAIGVPALVEGVLEELMVLDGDRVEEGQVVAVLIDEDARLAAQLARAQLTESSAAIAEARARAAVDEARAEEARESLRRVEHLAGTGAFAEGEIVDKRLNLASHVASVASARAAISRAEADEQIAQVALEQAELDLSRTRVSAPTSGVVLQRLVEPGQRLMRDANNPFAGVVVRLYDPAHIQVRVDVPLADAAKVRIGDTVEITTETLPGRTFQGTLTRVVHEANLQKNTVQVKVSIVDPAPELKPDMLAKARITTRAPDHPGAMALTAVGTADGVLIIPRAALLDASGSQALAWVLDRPSSSAVKRTLRLGRTDAESAEVLDGLRPGDRVILNPPADLRPGVRVRPAGEEEGR